MQQELRKIVDAHSKMSGDDAIIIEYGLASCSVMKHERRSLSGGPGARIDGRYGNSGAAIGTTAAIITTIALLAKFDPAAREHFVLHDTLSTALERSCMHLREWKTAGTMMSYEDQQSLEAERRALARAYATVQASVARTQSRVDTVMNRLEIQLEAAMIGAFPPRRATRFNHDELMREAENGELLPSEMRHATSTRNPPWNAATPLVVPLAGLPGPPTATATGGHTSDESSASWVTTSASSCAPSETSSEFEVVMRPAGHTL